MANLWKSDDSQIADVDLKGFDVETDDGTIGRVQDEERAGEIGYLVVEGGRLLSRRRVVVPLGLVDRVDPEKKRVYIRMRTADITKLAPDDASSSTRATELTDVPGRPFSA